MRRAALDYNPSDDEPGGVRPQNVNNTIRSREEVARQFTLHQWRTNVWDSTVNVPPLPQRRTEQYYLDDAVPPESVIQDELRTANNSQRAAGSADSVVIPTRQPTVPPPPPSHRIPPLEVQMAQRRERGERQDQMEPNQEERQVQEGLSEDSQESTDSGEYTIRDGSEPSSGGFEGHYEDPAVSNRPRRRNPETTNRALSAVVGAVLPGMSNAHKIVQYGNQGGPDSFGSEVILGAVFVIGIIVGVGVVLCVMSCRCQHSAPLPSSLPCEGTVLTRQSQEQQGHRRNRRPRLWSPPCL